VLVREDASMRIGITLREAMRAAAAVTGPQGDDDLSGSMGPAPELEGDGHRFQSQLGDGLSKCAAGGGHPAGRQQKQRRRQQAQKDGLSLKCDLIKRRAYGLRNFETLQTALDHNLGALQPPNHSQNLLKMRFLLSNRRRDCESLCVLDCRRSPRWIRRQLKGC